MKVPKINETDKEVDSHGIVQSSNDCVALTPARNVKYDLFLCTYNVKKINNSHKNIYIM